VTKLDVAPVIVDFETSAIAPRPEYPPKPCSVSIKEPGKAPVFWAWGHPIGNNCSREDAKRRLKTVWRSDQPLLFHNEKFDIDVAETHLGMPRLPWERYHDTMFLAFLDNPDRTTLSLKPLWSMEFNRRAVARDRLQEWILANVPEAKSKPKQWGAHISKAPGQLVEPYAKDDTKMPEQLFNRFYPRIVKQGMLEAYDRERRIMLPLLDNEREGIRVDHARLRRDLKFYEGMLERADDILRKMLKSPGMDIDKNAELARALDDAGAIEDWVMTKPSKKHPEGQRSTAKQALVDSIDDDKLLHMLLYRGSLATNIRTFMRPWLAMADATGGRIHTQWNQVRQDYHGAGSRDVGARTGRLSSTPNFQNMQNQELRQLLLDKLAKFGLLARLLKDMRVPPGLSVLPLTRDYIIADNDDEEIVEGDASQQELRLLGHFEDGVLCKAYNDNPKLDMHTFAQGLINDMLGTNFGRRPVKDVGFGLVYGMGVGKLAKKSGETVETAAMLKKAYLNALPGIKALDKDLKQRARDKEPVITWGKRRYFCEPPKLVDGKIRTFEYKLINRLIQGSAADHTKEAIARYHELPPAKRRGRFLLTAHDSLVSSVPKTQRKQGAWALKWCIESVKFDVPMLAECKAGPSFGKVKAFK
jgi:DNA polymerase I-like protein with 3'-5' exonuclease and polymerase domains